MPTGSALSAGAERFVVHGFCRVPSSAAVSLASISGPERDAALFRLGLHHLCAHAQIPSVSPDTSCPPLSGMNKIYFVGNCAVATTDPSLTLGAPETYVFTSNGKCVCRMKGRERRTHVLSPFKRAWPFGPRLNRLPCWELFH